MSLSTFLLGAASSLLASLMLVILGHLDDLHYLFTSRRRYTHLDGRWFQYHLTTDSRHRPATFWSAHEEQLKVTSFGTVRGTSKGRHRPALTYRVRGSIRNNVMRLRLINQTARELSASFTYPRLLADDILVGVWVGQDYDEVISAGPVVLSRAERSAAELTDLVKDGRLLTVTGNGGGPPLVAREARAPMP